MSLDASATVRRWIGDDGIEVVAAEVRYRGERLSLESRITGDRPEYTIHRSGRSWTTDVPLHASAEIESDRLVAVVASVLAYDVDGSMLDHLFALPVAHRPVLFGATLFDYATRGEYVRHYTVPLEDIGSVPGYPAYQPREVHP